MGLILFYFQRLIPALLFSALFLSGAVLHAQEKQPTTSDSLIAKPTAISPEDTNKRNASSLEHRVDYQSEDSVVFDLNVKQVLLFGKAKMKYEDIEIDAEHVTMNLETGDFSAEGGKDSTGKEYGTPNVKQAGAEYRSQTVQFNLKTNRGVATHIITKEGEGYLHGNKIKKIDDKTMFISGGLFTTCELDHPHFAINFGKAKAVADDKIVTGPAWLSVSDIPLPLAIPFGYFPMTTQQLSGFLLPSYGHAYNRGYYLRGLGWYFAINDYLDAALTGDIYTNKSWAANARMQYAKRYKFQGIMDFRIENNKTGISQTPTYSEGGTFKINWTHRQSEKANPYRSFSAQVNIVSPTYSKYASNLQDYLTNTTQSNIAYSVKIGSKFNIVGSLGEIYNTNTRQITLDLPSISLSSSQWHPFRRKNTNRKAQWYENISIAYRGSLKNRIQSHDSLLFKNDIYKRMTNGIQHSIPIQSSMQIFKFFTWTNGLDYTARWNFSESVMQWDTSTQKPLQDTNYRFITSRNFYLSTNLSTRLYGIFQFKNGFIHAFRHVFTPSVALTYHPDFSQPFFNFYSSYTDNNGKQHLYSRSQYSIFGSPPIGESGALTWNLRNNLEMKVKSKKDTVGGERKLVLLEDLSLSGGYDFAADSLAWKPVQLQARTTLFQRIRINFSAVFTPYDADSLGRTINVLLWQSERKLLKRQRSQWDFNISWQFNREKKNTSYMPVAEKALLYSPFVNPAFVLSQIDFNVPWSLQMDMSYSQMLRHDYRQNKDTLSHIANIGINGDIALSPKWKIGIRTGYDFISREFTPTSIDFYRDLHCWEMRFNWIPFGYQQSWNFTIGIKASMLQDLKYEKRKDFRNYITY